jgi:hypothetical protein
MRNNLLSKTLWTLLIGGLSLLGFYGLQTSASTSAIATTVAREDVAAPAPSTDLPAQLLPVYGGSGGTAFSRDCGAGRVLTGLRYRSGLLLDAVGLLCRPVLSNGTLAPETTVGTLSGGGGGTSNTASCPTGQVMIGATIYFGSWVNGVQLWCSNWHAATRTWSGSINLLKMGNTTISYGEHSVDEYCESSAQSAHAIRGRSGGFMDALGLICDEP